MRRLLALLVIVLGLAACAARDPAGAPAPRVPSLAFLEDGKTTREGVLFRLGLPAADFEGERILVYRVAKNRRDGFLALPSELDREDDRLAGWADEAYSLVLVFDGDNVLRKHSLVPLK